MGAEREDTDPTAKRNGTEPGLGKASAGKPGAPSAPDDAPPPVDFDALHAALGDPLDYVEMGSGPALEKGNPSDDLLDDLEAAEELATGPGLRIGESSGRSSATYASARPHTIPPTRAPIEDPNAPAVIVATDTDTVPSAPPNMTVPLAASPHAAHFAGVPGVAPGSNPHMPAMGSGPHGAAPAHPSSSPHPAARSLGASYPYTPQPIPVQPRGGPQMTMRMPDRPLNARRGKTPTIVVRPRGPSTKQRLVAFMAMLLLVTACGIAVIVWRRPHWVGVELPFGAPAVAPTTSVPVLPSAALGAPSAPGSSGTNGTAPAITPVAPNSATTSSSSTAPAASASGSPASSASSASAKKAAKAPAATAPPHAASSAPSSRL